MRISEFTPQQIKLVRAKIEQTLWEIGLRVELAEVRDLCAAAGVGSCYNANGLSSENIVMGMWMKRSSDFLLRGIRLDTLDDSLESMEENKDTGYFLMDDLTLDNMRSGEFFSDKTMNEMGEFKDAPSMLERAQSIVKEISSAFVSPVPEDAQARVREYFTNKIYPRFQ